MRRATLHDVASMAGVSTRTVSRVVRDEPGFSPATRARVLDAIKKLGYRPNYAARSLVTRRTETIGLVVAQLTNPFFPEVADGVMRAARERGHETFLSATNDDPATQHAVLESLASHGVDALIISPAPGTEPQIRALADSGLPMVLLDFEIRHPNVGVVRSDIEGGARLATRHLVDTGRARIAMIASEWSSQRLRETGFLAAMGEAGRAPGPIVRRVPTIDGGRSAVEELVADDPDIDAIFAYNDLMAVGAIAELLARGRRVPDDVAVVGFDDIPLAQYTTPSVTTVRLDRERLGAEALAVAIAMIEAPGSSPEPVTIPVRLMQRASA